MNSKYASLALLITLMGIYASSIHNCSLWGDGSSSEKIMYNLAHIPSYALLTILWLKAFGTRQNTRRPSKADVLILLGLMLFAISDEIHQSFVPGRSASLTDIGLDVLGIVLGLGAFKIFGMFDVFTRNNRLLVP